ncbi:MAG: DNA adenine methylase [Candidatus Margulisbacteria bacterium]|nr:DNA adenine methylase [Candidatus Margulisiibacteriota bacterium]
MNKKSQVKPFLKWAGGKTQLIEKFKELFPEELNGKGIIKHYYEPFLGGGAVFFWVAQNCKIEEFHINEFNPEIFVCFDSIKKNVESVIKELILLKQKYIKLNETEKEAFFYEIRNIYNQTKKEFNYKKYGKYKWSKRTALTIFLNKTCFNGLYRVNSLGEFNVPFGRYKNPEIFDEVNLMAVSKLLEKTKLTNDDFEIVKTNIKPDSFVYFDPPYRPLNQTSSFNSYATTGFNDKEQLRLSHTFRILDKQGAKVMLSNSDPKNVNPNDNFFEDLYNGYNIVRVDAKRMINSNTSKRGIIKELVIKNY